MTHLAPKKCCSLKSDPKVISLSRFCLYTRYILLVGNHLIISTTLPPKKSTWAKFEYFTHVGNPLAFIQHTKKELDKLIWKIRSVEKLILQKGCLQLEKSCKKRVVFLSQNLNLYTMHSTKNAKE